MASSRALHLLCGLWMIAIVAWTASASADSAEIYTRAVELYQQKQCAEALPLFRQAHAATNSPNARLFIARCLTEQGAFVEAYEEMRTTVEEATERARSDEKYAPTRDAAAAELALLDAKVGKLIVAIADPPSDTSVRVNDAPLSSERIGRPQPVEPGPVRVVVEAPGHQTVERDVDVPAGQTRTLALALVRIGEAPQPPPDPEPVPEPDDGGIGALRIAGFVVAGVGVAGVGVFAGLATKAQSDYDALDAECGGAPCPQSEKERVDDGRSLTTIANVSLGVGAALIAGGVLMIIFGGADAPEEAEAASALVVPVLLTADGGTEGGALIMGGRF